MVHDVLDYARVVAAGEDEADAEARVFGQAGEGADGEGDVLLGLEAVDGEDDVGVVPGEGVPGGVGCGQRRLVGDVDAGVDDVELAGGGEGGPLRRHDGLGEGGVDGDGGRGGHAPLLPGVEGQAVEGLEPVVPALREEEVGEVAVEEGGDGGVEVLEEGEAGGQLVDEEGGGLQGGEFRGEVDLEDEVQLAQDGAQDGEAREDRGGD